MFQLRISAAYEALTEAACQLIITQNKDEEKRINDKAWDNE